MYDVELTLTLPWSVTLTSAVNALAHAVEALYGAGASQESDERALAAIRSLASGLHALRGDHRSLEARAELLYGAWLAGRCLAEVGMGLHHKLCHTLGEAFDLPHAPTHAVVLPYAMAYNEPAVAVVMDRIAESLASHSAPRAVQSLVRELRGPTTLAKIGLAGGDLDLAVARPYPNPRPVTRAGVLQLLQRAFSGELLRGR